MKHDAEHENLEDVGTYGIQHDLDSEAPRILQTGKALLCLAKQSCFRTNGRCKEASTVRTVENILMCLHETDLELEARGFQAHCQYNMLTVAASAAGFPQPSPVSTSQNGSSCAIGQYHAFDNAHNLLE